MRTHLRAVVLVGEFCKILPSSLHILYFQIGCLFSEELEQNVFVMVKQNLGSPTKLIYIIAKYVAIHVYICFLK